MSRTTCPPRLGNKALVRLVWMRSVQERRGHDLGPEGSSVNAALIAWPTDTFWSHSRR
jgi:hypothetical protein